MKLLKSRKGFTLIELLVVIGILAVLAAIAIPSVAGLIDRANKSADMTNANEMTNAIERFASEYELYYQDIASESVELGNLDGAQGRVYNVTGIFDRKGITAIESETGLRGKGINRDTKYPVNEETLKSIIENYTKTSSATFSPKQSDCEFYYSPEVGVVICAEEGSTVDELNHIAFDSDEDIAQFDTINWICLDETLNNVATNTKGTYGELENNVKETVIKTVIIKEISRNPEYNFEEGMTWQQWIDSEYNTSGYVSLVGEAKYPGDLNYSIQIQGCFLNKKISNVSEITEDVLVTLWRSKVVKLSDEIYSGYNEMYTVNTGTIVEGGFSGGVVLRPLASADAAKDYIIQCGYYIYDNGTNLIVVPYSE